METCTGTEVGDTASSSCSLRGGSTNFICTPYVEVWVDQEPSEGETAVDCPEVGSMTMFCILGEMSMNIGEVEINLGAGDNVLTSIGLQIFL